LFIDAGQPFFIRSYRISIQLLFLFIGPYPLVDIAAYPFQYNSCFCLSLVVTALEMERNDFNTTLVFVYPEKGSFTGYKKAISIQLLFLFILCRKMFMSK